MALVTQNIDATFSHGEDTKTDNKLSAKPSRLENMVFKGGTLVKRYGTEALSSTIDSGGYFSDGEALFTLNDELVRINDGVAYGLGSALNEWVTKSGGGTFAELSSTRIKRDTRMHWCADQATANGITMFAWQESAAPQQGIHVAVYDEVSGNFYQTGERALSGSSNGSCVRVLAIGSNLVLLFQDVIAGKVYSAYVPTGTPETAPVAAIIRTDLATTSTVSCFLDAVVYDSSTAIVAYASTGANITTMYVDSTGAVTSPGGATPHSAGVVTNANGPSLVGVQRDTAGNIYVFWGDVVAGVSKFFYLVYGPAWSAVKTTTTIVSGSYPRQLTTIEASANTLTWVAALGVAGLSTGSVSASGVVSASGNIGMTDQVRLVTEAFTFNGHVVVGVVSSNVTPYSGGVSPSTQPTVWVITLTGQPVARALSGLASDSAAISVLPAATNSYGVQGRLGKVLTSGDVATLLVYERGRLAFSSALYGQPIDVTPVGLTRVEISVTTANELPIMRLGETIYIGGALPMMYDGVQLFEAGLPVPPLSGASNGAGGGSLTAGQYQMRYLFSWVDARGQLVRSAPSPAFTWTAAGGDSKIFQLYPCPASTRDLLPQGATVQLEVYRTQSNGTVFFRDSSPSSPVYTTSSAFISYTTTQADTALVSGELLYTTGGVYDWLAPPPYSAACVFKERLVITGLEDPFETRVSSKLRKGEAVRFNEAWSIRVPTDTGPMVAVAALDDKLVLFTTGAAYCVVGDGPDLLGNNSFPEPQRITSLASGPVSSVVASCPAGIIYQDAQGFALLDRGLGFQYFGGEMEAYGTMTLRCATIVPAQRQVRLHVDSGDDTASDAVCLVFDYSYNQWSVFTGYGGLSACLYGGAYTRVMSTGTVLQEDSSVWTDNEVAFAWVVETPWLKVAGLQGFQRVYYALLLGSYLSDPTGLTWEVAYDYSGNAGTPTYDSQDTVTQSAADGTYTAGQPYQLERSFRIQKCEAMKFRLTEVPGSTGQGLGLTDMTLVVGVKPGRFKGLPESKRT